MPKTYFNLMKSDAGFNYRWIQPPQIAYLVSTIDEFGNNNVTPVTLGTCVGVNSNPNAKESNYYFAFSVGSFDVEDIPARNAFYNLEKNPECVISYPGSNLLEKIWVTGLPLPPRIDELEVAKLSPFEPKEVKPSGIVECPINIEAKVKSSCAVGDHYKLYICQAVAAHIDQDLLESDREHFLHPGVLAIDPLFETAIMPVKDKPPRLYFGKIDTENLIRTPDDIGSSKTWVGSFVDWIEDEFDRGKITLEKKKEILDLEKQWSLNPNPKNNENVEMKLTTYLTELVWERSDR